MIVLSETNPDPTCFVADGQCSGLTKYKFKPQPNLLFDVEIKQEGKTVEQAKGCFNYDSNVFELNQKRLELLKARYPKDYETVVAVGYKLTN
jgi:hypothetical protein